VACPRCNRAGIDAAARLAATSARPPRPRDSSGKFISGSQEAFDETVDSFDYGTLWRMLSRLGEHHRFIRFADVAGQPPDARFCILRHDVDYSLYSALRLARQEAERGLSATYFLLVNSAYYNVLSPSHADVPSMLAALGHEIGLHYDLQFFQRFPRERWHDLLDREVALLEELSGTRVVSIALHQPRLNADDPFRESTKFINAYADRFVSEIPYISDSCRAWPDAAWQLLAKGPLPDRFQLAIHPINWADHDRDRVEIFRGLHADLADAVLREGDELLAKIAVHPAVLEHDARIRNR
jgi:hypothetical protein